MVAQCKASPWVESEPVGTAAQRSLDRPPVRRGVLAGVTPEGRVLVRWGERSPVPAQLAIASSHRELLAQIRAKAAVLVDFIDGDLAQPVIVGLLRDRLDVDEAMRQTQEPNLELCATERLVLACGQASVELCQDGRVTVRGTHVATQSSGAVQLKGASVGIN